MSEDWRAELKTLRRRARSRTRGLQSVRRICEARGVTLSELRRALYSQKRENDRPVMVTVLRKFLGVEA